MTQWHQLSPSDCDKAFDQGAIIADFNHELEEEAYEKRDSRLIELLKHKCQELLGASADSHTYHLEDWWPNHTRYISLSAQVCTPAMILGLQSLLTGEFANYRIQLVVEQDLTNSDSSQLGALVVYPDRILVEHQLVAQCNLNSCFS